MDVYYNQVGECGPGPSRNSQGSSTTRPPDTEATYGSSSGSGTYSCPKCDAVFTSKWSVPRHMEIVHGDISTSSSSPRFRCPIPKCSYVHMRKDCLQSHIRTTHKKDPDKLIGKGPRGNGIVSSRPKKHKCIIDGCNAKYGWSSHLRRHVREFHKADPNEVLGNNQNGSCWGGSRKTGVPGGGGVGGGGGQDPLCILCCYSFHRDTSARKGNLHQVRLTKFATQILKDDHDEKSLSEIQVTLERFSVCPDCLDMTDVALEGKLEVEQLEQKIEELEHQLQLERRKLGKRMAAYCEGMRRLQDVVSVSDAACLENCLDADAWALGTTRKKQSPVLILRDGIISAATEVEEMVPQAAPPPPLKARKKTSGPPPPPLNIVEDDVDEEEMPLDIVAKVPPADMYSDPLDIDIKVDPETVDVKLEVEEVSTEMEQIDRILEEFSSGAEEEEDEKGNGDFHEKWEAVEVDIGNKSPPPTTAKRKRTTSGLQCGHCPIGNFKSKRQREKHWRRAHSDWNIEKPFKCDQCGKGFWSERDLGSHSASHSDHRPFVCRKGCGFRFKTRQNRGSHEKRCTGQMNVLLLSKWKNRDAVGDSGGSGSSGVTVTAEQNAEENFYLNSIFN